MKNLEEFVKLFADQFDDTDPDEITATVEFHNLDEWSSLIALSVLNMVEKKFGVALSFNELRESVTVEDIYKVICNK